MEILIVSTRFPCHRAGTSRRSVYQLARQLAKREDVTLLSYAVRSKRARQLTALGGRRSYHEREFLSGELQDGDPTVHAAAALAGGVRE